MKQEQHKTLKWHEGQKQEVHLKNEEDYQYAQVVKEIEHIKHELCDLKLDMKHALKEKKQAENDFKSSSSKKSTLISAIKRIQKEIEEIDEEHVLVELARIEAVKEIEANEAQREEEANRYQIHLEEVKKKVKEVDQQNELTQELKSTLYNVNLLEQELARAKETNGSLDSLQTIKEELETAKNELANINEERFHFMTSIDVIKNELKLLLEEKARLEKEEEKQEFTIQTLNSKLLMGKAELETVITTTEKANAIVSNLALTVEQLRAEIETSKKENDIITQEIEKTKSEITKTELQIGLSEKRLEAAMDELKTAKESEFTALENLKNKIDSTVQSRELTSVSRSTIKITDFEYEYLTRNARYAEEMADKKVVAAQAWVEALRANEKEILMKIETTKQEIKKIHMETIDRGLNRWGQNGDKFLASMYRIGIMTPGRRARSARHTSKSVSFNRKREKVSQSLEKLSNKNGVTDE